MAALDAAGGLVTRDLRMFLRSRSQIYSSLLFPLMLLAIIGTGVSEGLDPGTVRDYITFLVPGIIVMTALFSSTFSNASYYQDRDSGMLPVLLASPHSPRLILGARSLSGVIVGTAQALLVLVVAALVPAVDFAWQYGVVQSLLVALYAILALNFFLAGLGQLLASRISTMQGFHLVMNLVLFPLLFFSGAFFPLSDLPLWLELLGRINPLSYAVDMLHLALYAENSEGYFGLTLDFVVLTVLAAGVFYAGAARPAADR